ncbi:Clan SC, family S9, unassigned serine peptidase [Tritrichomonas foetus]|uniref:Clan SC, family S9, unassigned serine peptidase n=1 Tax=Tritrichomonas foetus TaxID=1144522 RepID=A0A1J4J959_9EUKA|nr:Clan SC, family S9, unassigned serine peptidase [Tritrichomonas foetus]|eukprot:OHS95722.1 Clan SC, family S9, unassigned serine peptidase [Tritrichomonas foetus]
MIKKGVKLITRPPRSKYDPNKLPLVCQLDSYGDVPRSPIIFKNSKGDSLVGSLYQTYVTSRKICAIYLHGNASNQLEGRFITSFFIPVGINVFCFDFSGCGCSSGQVVSLGYYEQDDVLNAITILKNEYGMEEFILWGRSMGAAVSIMDAAVCSDIKGICVDSPYSSLYRLFADLGKSKNVPKWIVRKAIKKVRKKVQKNHKFDIFDAKPILSIEKLNIPVFIIHGKKDSFVNKQNSQRLYENCPSNNKQIRIVEGKHNTRRPLEVLIEATIFLCNSVGIKIEFPSLDEENSQQEFDINANQHFSDVDDMLKLI